MISEYFLKVLQKKTWKDFKYVHSDSIVDFTIIFDKDVVLDSALVPLLPYLVKRKTIVMTFVDEDGHILSHGFCV